MPAPSLSIDLDATLPASLLLPRDLPSGGLEPVQLALGAVFVTLLVAVTLTDLERRVIPNTVLACGALAVVGIAALADPDSLPERSIAALGAGGFLLAPALAYPAGMGMGDVKLAAVMGLYLERDVAPALIVALAAGALYGLALIAREGTAARKRAVPFGPFLAFGGVVALLAGSALINAYTQRFTN